MRESVPIGQGVCVRMFMCVYVCVCVCVCVCVGVCVCGTIVEWPSSPRLLWSFAHSLFWAMVYVRRRERWEEMSNEREGERRSGGERREREVPSSHSASQWSARPLELSR